jgi:thiol-disulfide isomerase/thioredoxin
MIRQKRSHIILISICLASCIYAKTVTKPVLPTYKLPVGKNLIYNASSEFKGKNYSSVTNTTTQFLVWSKNPDGSFRIIVNRNTSGYRIMQDTIRKDNEPQTTWTYFDLFPDGMITDNVSIENFDPSLYFIPLPTDTIIARQGWESFDSSSHVRNLYRIENSNFVDSIWKIGIAQQTPFDSIYLISSSSVVSFNMKKGLMIKKESESSTDYGYSSGKTNSLISLDSIKPIDTMQLRPFVNELVAYFQMESTYNQILEKVEYNTPDANLLMTHARDVIVQTEPNFNDSTIISMLNDLLDTHEHIKNNLVEDSLWFAKTLNKKAADWKLKDLSEKMHSLKQYKGKVVILDFWYRGCPWCIRAMPMINQIAKDFSASQVAVLGMNIDKDINDALFVVDKMNLVYPSLQCGDVYKKYGVTGFPTLFVIDKKGVIRDIHIGYSPDLGEKVTKKIESLLGK